MLISKSFELSAFDRTAFTRPTPLEIDTSVFIDFEPTVLAIDLEGLAPAPSAPSGFASAGGSFSASGSGFSSISVSASAYTGSSGSFSSVTADLAGDVVSGSAFAVADFGGISVSDDLIDVGTGSLSFDLDAFVFDI
ncbi:MAG: hypothetical protein AAFR79_02895 [Pseudomonadota bacterium]